MVLLILDWRVLVRVELYTTSTSAFTKQDICNLNTSSFIMIDCEVAGTVNRA